MTVRLPGLRPDDLNEEQAQVYRAIAGGPRASGPFPLTDEKGHLRGPFNAMLLSPPVGLTLQAVGASVRYNTVLTDRVRETIQSTLGQDGVGEERVPILGCAIAGHDDRARTSAFADQLVQVIGLLRGELAHGKVVDDQQRRLEVVAQP